MITNRALYTLSSDQLRRLEVKHRNLPFGYHDWQDIRQTILIKIFAKRHLIKDGLNVKGYVHMLISRAFQNHMRDLLHQQTSGPTRRAALAVKFPGRLMTKIKEETPWGDQYISYTPDIAAEPDNIRPEDKAQVAHIIDMLPPESRAVLTTYAETSDWGETAKRLKLKYHACHKMGRCLIAQVRHELANA